MGREDTGFLFSFIGIVLRSYWVGVIRSFLGFNEEGGGDFFRLKV